MTRIVYFSGLTLNTHRFIEKLEWEDTYQIPLQGQATVQEEPFILVTPSYGTVRNDHIPPQVKRFFTTAENRPLCLGVIGTGNMNFGDEYAAAGKIIARKLRVPYLYSLELAGTTEDVRKVQEGLTAFLRTQQQEITV